MSSSTHIPAKSTIPPWPSQATDVSNVYYGCAGMNWAWTTSAEDLMPRSITRHSNAVKNSGTSLMELFDVDWGGTSNIFFDITFYDEENRMFSPTGDWENPQLVKVGNDAELPPLCILSSHCENKPEDLYTSSWNGRWQKVDSDADVTLVFTHKTHHAEFYDLYNLIHHGGEIDHLKDYDKDVPRREAVTVPPTANLQKRGYTVLGWTLSSGITESTSGEILEDSFFDEITSDFKAYLHGAVNEYVNVTFRYYKNDIETYSTCTIAYNTCAVPPALDNRTGYTNLGWYIGKDFYDDASILSHQYEDNTEVSANYNIIRNTIGFYEGVRPGTMVDSISVNYGNSVSPSRFPTTYQTSSFKNEYKDRNNFEWDCTDTTKFTNVTSNTALTAYIRTMHVKNDLLIPSKKNSYTIDGYIDWNKPNGSVAISSLQLDIPDDKRSMFSIANSSTIGGAFSFDFQKTDAVPNNHDEVFYLTVWDTDNLSYTVPLSISMNYDYTVLHANETSWWRSDEKYDQQGNLIDGLNQPMEKVMQNPNTNNYLGVFQSCSGWHKNDMYSRCRVSLSGFDDFTLYAKYDGEDWNEEYSWGDFLCVGKLNESLSTMPSMGDENIYKFIKSSTVSSSEEIAGYTEITFDGLDRNTTYFFDIAYVKDSYEPSQYEQMDRGFILFDLPNQYNDRIGKFKVVNEKITD